MSRDSNVFMGQGYNSLTHELSEHTALQIDRAPSETPLITGSEDQLMGKILVESPPQGLLSIKSIESVADLHKLASSSASLAAKFQELGASLDVSASKEETIDVTKFYYIVRISNPEIKWRIAGVPTLSEDAKKTLGLSSKQLKKLADDVTQKQEGLSKANTDLAMLQQQK
jgi:hypothetical protein